MIHSLGMLCIAMYLRSHGYANQWFIALECCVLQSLEVSRRSHGCASRWFIALLCYMLSFMSCNAKATLQYTMFILSTSRLGSINVSKGVCSLLPCIKLFLDSLNLFMWSVCCLSGRPLPASAGLYFYVCFANISFLPELWAWT